tara:strand:+ start:15316 stop:15597 length:282 start_codon:yes stop_codon:yes gene_type:complete
LAGGCLSKGVIGSAHDCHEDLCFGNLTGVAVDEGNRVTGIVAKQFFTSAVILAHGHIPLSQPASIMIAEPAVVAAIRVQGLDKLHWRATCRWL